MEFEKRIDDLYLEVVADFKQLNIKFSDNVIAVKVNSRAKARFGCCKRKKIFGRKEGFIIEISRLLDTARDEAIKNVIAHELLHTIDGCYNHGIRWKAYASKLNEYGYEVSRVSTYEELGIGEKREMPSYKYLVTCQKCGQEIYRKRKCKLTENTNSYRCGKCGGRLKCREL